MKLLIAGASGFIGTHVLRRLPSDWEVFAISRKPIAARPNTTLINVDLTNLDFARSLPGQIDAVLSLAQSAHYAEFPAKTRQVFDVNVMSSISLVDYAIRARASTFVHASTGSVYEPYGGLLKEDALLSPSSLNGVSKFIAERSLELYDSLIGLCCLRIFFPFGPGQKNRLVQLVHKRLSECQPVDLDGPDGMVFTPTYVEDIADIMATAIEEGWRGTINVASQETRSVRSVAEGIAHILGAKPQFNHTGSQSTNITPDTTKLYTLYEHAKMTDFQTALHATIDSIANDGTLPT